MPLSLSRPNESCSGEIGDLFIFLRGEGGGYGDLRLNILCSTSSGMGNEMFGK